MNSNSLMNNQDQKNNRYFSEYGVISLKPKEKILAHLKDIAEDLLDLDEDQLDKLLNDNILESHTVPVCIPRFSTADELFSFIKNNSNILLDIMLTSWPFSINQWHFSNKNIGLLENLIDIKYFPIVCKALIKPVKSTIDLAVTFATPTEYLINYIAENLVLNKITRSNEEMRTLDIILATGIAIVTNTIEKSNNQDTNNYIQSFKNSVNCLEPALKSDIVTTLFSFYFKNKEEFPLESSNDSLNKWFTTNTYLGLYQLTDTEIVKMTPST